MEWLLRNGDNSLTVQIILRIWKYSGYVVICQNWDDNKIEEVKDGDLERLPHLKQISFCY